MRKYVNIIMTYYIELFKSNFKSPINMSPIASVVINSFDTNNSDISCGVNSVVDNLNFYIHHLNSTGETWLQDFLKKYRSYYNS